VPGVAARILNRPNGQPHNAGNLLGEIHPVLKFEYCDDGDTCRADSDENWKDLDKEPSA